MNLGEYRRELDAAHREYREALERAGESLHKRLLVAQGEFLGENEKAVMAEDVPARYRDRENY